MPQEDPPFKSRTLDVRALARAKPALERSAYDICGAGRQHRTGAPCLHEEVDIEARRQPDMPTFRYGAASLVACILMHREPLAWIYRIWPQEYDPFNNWRYLVPHIKQIPYL